jgi:hypothetical protein
MQLRGLALEHPQSKETAICEDRILREKSLGKARASPYTQLLLSMLAIAATVVGAQDADIPACSAHAILASVHSRDCCVVYK